MDPLSVLTWNIQRYNAPWYLAPPWHWRKPGIARRLHEAGADVVCLQEVLHPVRPDIEAALPDHQWIGVGRNDGGTEGEYAPILYNESKLELHGSGRFWLSEQPERPSIGWDANQPRIATWAKLHAPAIDQSFLLINTHFDHRGRRAREQAAWLLAREALRLSRGDPILITGDFNARTDDRPMRTLQLFMMNGDLDPNGAAVGPKVTHALGRIDHVLYTRHFTRVAAHTLPGGHMSDHAALLYKLAFDWPRAALSPSSA